MFDGNLLIKWYQLKESGQAPEAPDVECIDMTKKHRIAAGGITFKDDSVLLVRYPEHRRRTYLVAPGGALEDSENIVQAIIRETKEETNLVVQPKRVVIIEDIVCSKFKMCKIWMICDYIGGEICSTDEAKREGIVEAAWFTKSQLRGEVVFPQPLIHYDWDQLRSENWQVECLPSRAADM